MISIIVPVYNGESYIERNFDSLMSQTNLNYEVIYVNDGSVDRSKQILSSLISDKVKLINSNNHGVMAARHLGVKYALYDYITFLDVDDILDSNFVEIFYREIEKNKCDMYCTNFQLLKSNNIRVKSYSLKKGNFSKKIFINNLCRYGGWELCGKVFEKKLFALVEYPSKVTIGEDALVLFQLAYYANKINVLDNHLYIYIHQFNSASNIRSVEKCRDGIKAGIYIKKFLQSKNIIDDSYLNSLILLFFSNSLTRGVLSSSDPLLKDIRMAVKIDALNLISVKKRIIVIIGIILTWMKH